LSASIPSTHAPYPARTLRLDRVRHFFLWITVFSGFFVLIEPAPYDVLVLATIGVLCVTGIRWHRALGPLFVLLFLYHFGAAVSLMKVLDDDRTVQWTIVGFFLAIKALFIAMAVQDNTLARVRVIYGAWIAAAVVSSLIGVMAYFGVMPSADTFLIYGNRVKSTFKDANVFGPFLVLPAVYLVQKLYKDGLAQIWLVGVPLVIILLALLLTYSRGAWGHFTASALVMTVLTFMTSNSQGERARITFAVVAGVVVVAMVIAALLSVDSIGETLRQRAALEQDYDGGEMGRFGRHSMALDVILDNPFGIGMLQFGKMFGEDPHNTYINAFLSYTWLGGFAFVALIILTFYMCIKLVFQRTPWQPHFICAFATFFVVMLEAWIIDIDHWRHVYLLLGLCWGMIAATIKHPRSPPPQYF
jgi:hypothetical protein